MRTRKSDWFDIEDQRQLFSFQIFHPEQRKWMNPIKGNEQLIYETEEERDAAQAEVGKIRFRALEVDDEK